MHTIRLSAPTFYMSPHQSLLLHFAPNTTHTGKSTLMRILMNQEEPLEGYSEFATNSIVPAYYAQNQADALDLEMTVLETVMQAVHQGRCNFSQVFYLSAHTA